MEIRVYYRDTDCGGVVYYANYLDYFERARTQWMETRGVNIKELADNGVLFVVKHAELDYRTPAKYGDILKIETQAENISGASMDFSYNVKEKESGRLIVTGTTKMVCINEDMKPRRIPRDVLERLKR